MKMFFMLNEESRYMMLMGIISITELITVINPPLVIF